MKNKQYNSCAAWCSFLLTTGSPLAMFNTNFAFLTSNSVKQTEQVSLSFFACEKIDAYFAKRNMPLEGYGAKLVKLPRTMTSTGAFFPLSLLKNRRAASLLVTTTRSVGARAESSSKL